VNVVNVVFVSIQGTQSVNLASTKAWDVKILHLNNVGMCGLRLKLLPLKMSGFSLVNVVMILG
jgi:hypothetical protein